MIMYSVIFTFRNIPVNIIDEITFNRISFAFESVDSLLMYTAHRKKCLVSRNCRKHKLQQIDAQVAPGVETCSVSSCDTARFNV